MKKILRILFVLIGLVILTLSISYLVSGGPSTILSHVRIQKPSETVFDFISDMRNELIWNPDVMFMEKVSEGPVSKGTRFRAKWHMSDTLDVVIVDYERASKVTFVNGGPLEVRLEVKLKAIGSETEMESRFIATPHGFIRAIFPIFKKKMKSQEQENMVNLKKTLEK